LKVGNNYTRRKIKMKKTRIATCVLLLLLSLTAAISILDVKSAFAGQVAVQWGYLADGAPAGEGNNESWICDQIYWNFYNTGTWWPSNAYWTYTQLWCVAQVLQYCQSPYTGVNWATTWWVGDFKPNYPYYGFYGHADQHIFDYQVGIYANHYYWGYPYFWWQPVPSKQYFDFIWTCSNGGLYWYDSSGYTWPEWGITKPDNRTGPDDEPDYTPSNPFTQYGYVANPYYSPVWVAGMPLAWTGRVDMSTDGYDSPDYGSYCYVGWENKSPYMIDATEYQGLTYKYFPYYFYRYALGYDNNGVHATIADSLDYASLRVCGSPDFGSSDLYDGYWKYADEPGTEMDGWWYCRMSVLGNSNLILPY
jgi:hypothetical protein